MVDRFPHFFCRNETYTGITAFRHKILVFFFQMYDNYYCKMFFAVPD